MKNLLKQLPLSLISVSLLITGCATVTEEGKDFKNKQTYGIDCSGTAISMDTCYEKAAKLCPAGYTVIPGEVSSPAEKSLWVPSSFKIDALIANSIPGVKKGIRVSCN